MRWMNKHWIGVAVLTSWLVLGVLALAQPIEGLNEKVRNNLFPNANVGPLNAQMSREAQAHHESCAQLIAAYGEPYKNMKAALEVLANQPLPTPAKDAEVLRGVRFNRLPRNYARVLESYYLLCEAQAGGGQHLYRLHGAAGDLAAWAGLSPVATARLAPLAAAAGGSTEPDDDGGSGRFDPGIPVAFRQGWSDIRISLLPFIKELLRELDEKDERKTESNLNDSAGSTKWGQYGQLKDVIIAAAEKILERKLTAQEGEQVWKDWLAGKSLTEICSALPKEAPSVAPSPARKRTSFAPARKNPSAGLRACIKSYAAFCELDVEKLLLLPPAEFATHREQIESCTTVFELQLASSSPGKGQELLRQSLQQGMSAEQVRLYGDFLLLRAHAHHRDPDGLVKSFAKIEATRGLRAQYVYLDEAEEHTHYTEASLQNIVLLYGLVGRLAESQENAIAASKQLLDNYNEFRPHFPLLGYDDPRTIQDETDSLLFFALYQRAQSRPDSFMDGNRVEQTMKGWKVTIRGQQRSHTVVFDRAGKVTNTLGN
jgi:hypothetical protein